ncbi:Spy/CpxP family protein refolding chaperone [Pseudothioclava nitratireducens]|uniref:Spy/CpxP family protein refolding chaperone n=1 Tax=Pseudothioclava nitratireducens TaxID=1928646 RepID=UPI0023D98F01|nr:Spy/CpxP family protein refolding chaperone [Defluviimonas nitratireducens]MDF1620884.1 hypothetical protein [Defluviimonas nitratireducens]
MKHLIFAAALLASTSLPALAQNAAAPTPQELGLSAPVVMLTGVIAKNADALELDETQRAAVKEWVATMPGKRQAYEAETADLRAQLRAAIIANAPAEERQALADQIGAHETQLVMMRSNCVDNWRKVLSPEQFDKALELAKLK